MNNLIMLPIGQLEHHPDNPRKELGDLKELIASIKASGVMQNLTVVPREDAEGYYVVIGNRRLEASRAAGLEKLPCIVSDMDYRTQLATMMAENMQRVDLTLVEQAQGVQMMMDLGMDEAAISKATGLRKDSIRRRAALSKYDAGKVREAMARGGTLQDFAALEEIEDAEDREYLLGRIGTSNFASDLQWKKRQAAGRKIMAQIIAKLEGFATQIDRQGYVGSRVVPMRFVSQWYNPMQSQADKLAMPEDIRDVHYYWHKRQDGTVTLYKEDVGGESGDPEHERRQRIFQEATRRWNRAEELYEVYRDTRYEFIHSGHLTFDVNALLRTFVKAQGMHLLGSTFDTKTREGFTALTGLKVQDKGYAQLPEREGLNRAANARTANTALALLWACLDKVGSRCHQRGSDCVEYRKSDALNLLYELLTSLGYRMTDEEEQYMAGTHEVYGRVVVE